MRAPKLVCVAWLVVVCVNARGLPRCERAACLPWPATFPPKPTAAPVTTTTTVTTTTSTYHPVTAATYTDTLVYSSGSAQDPVETEHKKLNVMEVGECCCNLYNLYNLSA